jgi:hypothetical protein
MTSRTFFFYLAAPVTIATFPESRVMFIKRSLRICVKKLKKKGTEKKVMLL